MNSFEDGVAAERERVLSLLRDLRSRAKKVKGITTNVNINAVIALIKGEQK